MKELATSFVSFLAFVSLVGGAWMFYHTPDKDTKMVIAAWIGMVLGYFFQSTRSSQEKTATIAKALENKNVSGQ